MVRFMDRLNEKMELLDEKIQNKAAKAGEDYGHFIRILADTLRQQETRRDTRTLREKENRRGPKL